MEKVLAVSADKITRLVPQGFIKTDEKQMLEFVAREGKYHDRTPELENDTTLKQIIPYVLVSHADKFLVYQRAPKLTETRLQKKFSLAFGGHINPEDAEGGRNPVIGGRTRELREELSLPQTPEFSFLGTLNVNLAPIDRHHMGFAYRAEVPTPEFALNEPDKFIHGGWETPAQIAERFITLESWSQVVFASLFPALVRSSADTGHSL